MTQSITRNAVSASAQMAVTTVAGLFYIGYLMRVLGPDTLGGWLAWLALGMLACIADLGLRESLVRRIAIAHANSDGSRMKALLDTTIITVGTTMALALGLLLGLGPQLVELEPAFDEDALLVGGIAIMIWLQRVGDVYAAAVEGLQRYDLVARNNVFGALAGAFVLVVAVPAGGVAAASVGLIVQYVASGVAHAMVLRRLMPQRWSWWPAGWSATLAREGLGYGLSVQAAVASFLLIESLTKLLLAQAGALALLSYYDLAFRIGRGLRNLLVAGNRVLVPRLAQTHAGADQAAANRQARSIYLRSFHLLLFLTVPAFAVALALADATSLLVRGSVEPAMSIAFWLALPPWFTLCAIDPVINLRMGADAMRPVVVAHGVMPVLLVLLAGAWMLGLQLAPALEAWTGPAILLSAALSISLPCLLLLIHHHRSQRLDFSSLQPWRSASLATIALLLGGLVGLLPQGWAAQSAGWAAAALAMTIVLRALPAWPTVWNWLQQRRARLL